MVCACIIGVAVIGLFAYFGYSYLWDALLWIITSWFGLVVFNGFIVYIVCIGLFCTYIPFARHYPDRLKVFATCVGIYREKLKASGFFEETNKQKGTHTYPKDANQIQESIDTGFIVIVNAVWMNFMIFLGSALIYWFPYWDHFIIKSPYYFVMAFAAAIGNHQLISVPHYDLTIIQRTQNDIDEEEQDRRDLEREQQEAEAAARVEVLPPPAPQPVVLEQGPPAPNPQPAGPAPPRPGPARGGRNRNNGARPRPNQRRWRYRPTYPIEKFYENPQRGVSYFGMFAVILYPLVIVGGRVLAQGLVFAKNCLY